MGGKGEGRMQMSPSYRMSVSVLNEQSGQHLWRPKTSYFLSQEDAVFHSVVWSDVHDPGKGFTRVHSLINCLKKQTQKWRFVKVLYGAVSSIQTNGNGDRTEAKHRHICHKPTAGYRDSILRKSLENRVGSSFICLRQGTVGVAVISIHPHSLVFG